MDALKGAAASADWVRIEHDGVQWKVLGQGKTPSQRTVSWIEPEADSTSAFIAALGQSFSNAIQSAVVKELALGPDPGKPLSARTVLQAIEMAQTMQASLSGVDFLTQLNCSAKSNTSLFRETCKQAGIDSEHVSEAQRQGIDDEMQRLFSGAASAGQSPVSPAIAQDWLKQQILSALQRP